MGAFVEEKGGFDYLSWSFAISQLFLAYPDAWFGWKENTDHGEEDGWFFFRDKSGPYVVAMLNLGVGCPRFEFPHPILDNRNKTIHEPNSMDVNTSKMRAMVKLIAMVTGIGLGLYVPGKCGLDRRAPGILVDGSKTKPDPRDIMNYPTRIQAKREAKRPKSPDKSPPFTITGARARMDDLHDLGTLKGYYAANRDAADAAGFLHLFDEAVRKRAAVLEKTGDDDISA